jgi:hypothetical protein
MSKLFGKFVWFECVTPDADKAKAFYGEVLGWKVQEHPMGDRSYAMIAVDGAPVGGYAEPQGGAPPHWTSYVSVQDCDATAKKVVKAGGKLLVESFDVPEVGRMAMLADPQGASFWLLQSIGDDAADAPSTEGRFHWNELWAKDGNEAASFYADVLGYQIKEMPMPTGAYHVLERDGVPRGGIMTSPRSDVPPMWLPYVTVEDCDATVKRAEKLGAEVQAPPSDIPEVGRFAILTDPIGATFAIIKPAG